MVVMTSNDVMIVMTSTAKKEWKSLLSSYQVKIILDIEQALNSHLMMAIRQTPLNSQCDSR